MDNKISGDSPLTPESRAFYEQKFEESLDLFQKSLSEFQRSTMPAQKEKFKEVMSKARLVMNETAKSLLNKGTQSQEKEFEKDYLAFLANQSPKTLAALKKDIEKIKNSM
jgi:hypothetical protein